MYLKPDFYSHFYQTTPGLQFLITNYPNGDEIKDILNHEDIPMETIHFLIDAIEMSAEEHALAYGKLGIESSDPVSIYRSYNVKNSENIFYSKEIEDSRSVRHSESIRGSAFVTRSMEIECSKNIDHSEFVFSSNNILLGQNVTDSSNIVAGKYIVGSQSVYNGEHIIDSKWIHSSKNLNDCFLCSRCSDLRHAICCSQVSGEYMVFNHEVSEADFELIKRQMTTYIQDWQMNLLEPQIESEFSWENQKVVTNFSEQYKNLPSRFLRWVHTLPNYDAMILYSITLLPEVLVEKKADKF
jgi:hypothetical protein